MAYREFHFEKTYAAPDMGILERGSNQAAANMSGLFKSIADQQLAKKKAADQYKFDLGEGKFENDDKIFYQLGLDITGKAKQDIRQYGRISPETERRQNEAITFKKQSDWQYKRFEDTEKAISAKEKEDTYYDGGSPTDENSDRGINKLSSQGKDNQMYFATRGESQDAADKIIGKNPNSLKGDLYTADWVKTFAKKQSSVATGDPTYSSKNSTASPFLTPQGTVGITVDHAKQYLSSRQDGSVERWIGNQVDQDMLARDVKYNKDRNPDMKGMNDQEALLYLKANPKENKLDSKDYATRVIEKAQYQIAQKAELTKNTDYESKIDKSITGGQFKNDHIGYSATTHTDAAMESKGPVIGPQGQYRPVPTQNVMPGANLLIGKGDKIGQAIPVQLNPRRIYNTRTGENANVRGATKVNMTGYQLQLYDSKGNVIATDYKDVDKLSATQLKDSQLKIAIRGFTIENGNKLGEIAARKSQLDEELGKAKSSGDVEKQGIIQDQLLDLEDLKRNMNVSQDEFSETDLLSAFKRNGIPVSSVQRDVLLDASESDIKVINQITQGLDLNDKGKWSNDMVAFEQRVDQLRAGASSGKPTVITPDSPDVLKGATVKSTGTAKPKQSVKTRTITYNGQDLEVPPGRIAMRKPDGTIVSVAEGQRKMAESKGYTSIE